MKIIETIQIKSFSEKDRDRVLHFLKDLAVKGAEIPRKIKLFNSQNLPTDISICLYWDKEIDELKKSDLAEKLSAALKYFGWISHNIWKPLMEETSCLEKK
jgi:hypothetical protein